MAKLPNNWEALRQAVLRRDHRRCIGCYRAKTDEVSMIVPRAEHGDYRLRNLITLCQSCRSAVTAAQKAHPTYMRTWTSIKDSYKPVMPGYLLSTQWVTTTPGDPDKTWHLWVYAGKKRD